MSEPGDRVMVVAIAAAIALGLAHRARAKIRLGGAVKRALTGRTGSAPLLQPLLRSRYPVGFAGDRRSGLTSAVWIAATLVGLCGLGIAITGLLAC